MTITPGVALLAVSALHLGFQAVVSLVLYPALADVPAAAWPVAHERHSRRIVRLVAPLYLGVVAVCLWTLVDTPPSLATGLAVSGNALAVAATALLAAPTHGRLGRDGPSPDLLRTLFRADRLRLLAVILAFVASLAL